MGVPGMKKLGLGIVGCGEIAGFTALVSRLVPQVRLAACCDLDSDRAAAFARRHGIRSHFSEYGALLQQAEVQAVYLAVPHHLHYPMIREAWQAGKAVLVEKPLTRTLAEGRLLAEAVGCPPTGVNYQYRYDRGCYALARAVQAGALGRVLSIRINVPWRRSREYFTRSPWHRRLDQSGGGTLLTQASHFLDIALWALGEPVISAEGVCSHRPPADWTAEDGELEVETAVQALLVTEGGTTINLSSSMLAAREGAVSIEVYGEAGTAVYTDRPYPRVRFQGVKVKRQSPPGWGVHALQRSLTGFAGWVLDDRPYLTPLPEALPVLAAVEAVYLSARRTT
jgi:UDP-N-acetyl-2-amino-2-deoxyglucuronate dehydrogenase